MGWYALWLALAAALCALLPGPGVYLGLGLGLFSSAAGWVGYRRLGAPAPRLAGAAALAIALVTVGLAAVRYLLMWAALGRVTDLAG